MKTFFLILSATFLLSGCVTGNKFFEKAEAKSSAKDSAISSRFSRIQTDKTNKPETQEQQVVERKAVQIQRSLPEKLESSALRDIAVDLATKNIVHTQLEELLVELDEIEKEKARVVEEKAKMEAEAAAAAKEREKRIKELKEKGVVVDLDSDDKDLATEEKRLAALEAKLAECGIAKPKLIDVISGGTKLSPANVADEVFAAVLAKWNTESVQILAKHILGQKVTKIQSLGIYNCRTVNRKESSKLSQHAYGQALDVAGFVLADGTKISLSKNYEGTDKKRHFLKAIEKQACQYFSTNISPLDNKAHTNHFHFDIKFKDKKQKYCTS